MVEHLSGRRKGKGHIAGGTQKSLILTKGTQAGQQGGQDEEEEDKQDDWDEQEDDEEYLSEDMTEGEYLKHINKGRVVSFKLVSGKFGVTPIR